MCDKLTLILARMGHDLGALIETQTPDEFGRQITGRRY